MTFARAGQLGLRQAVRWSSTSAAATEAAAAAKGSAKGAINEASGAAKAGVSQTKAAINEAASATKSAVASATPSAPSGPIVVGRPTIRRPIGSVRGGMMGFLLGFTLASSYGYYYLLKEYNAASNLMLASVEELQSSTTKIQSHLSRLNKLEQDLKSFTSKTAGKEELEKHRVETKKILDGLSDDVLDVRKKVLDLPRPTKYMQ